MGSGKSTVGVALAEQLHVDFKDLDEQIAAAYKCSIPQLFQKKGAKEFRQIENNMLLKALKNGIGTLGLKEVVPLFPNANRVCLNTREML